MKKNETQVVLGIDGGGTKTVALVADMDGTILGRGEAGSAYHETLGIDKAFKNIHSAASVALRGIDKPMILSVCLGLAGCDTACDHTFLKSRLIALPLFSHLRTEHIVLCNDSKIGLFSGITGDYGVVIVAGTGSNCYGINQGGSEAKSGGWKHLISDEGSAYWIGKEGIQAAVRQLDGRGKETLITELLFAQINQKDIFAIIDWVYNSKDSRNAIAGCSPCVSRAFLNGDAVATDIINRAADELSLMATTVIKKLKMEDDEFEIVLIGGVFKTGELFVEKLVKRIQAVAPNVQIVFPKNEPAYGAIRLALKNISNGELWKK